MNNLLNFFVKHSSWFLFAFYVIVSCMLLFKNNPYQQSVYFTSANALSAKVYEGMSSITSYFNLKSINEELQQRNSDLEMRVIELNNELARYKAQAVDTLGPSPWDGQFSYVLARVISNSIAMPNNYITINRGSADGVEPEMGVVDHNGVVGIVNVTSAHAARVISLLNPYLKLSCKVRNSEFFGSMIWDGESSQYAILEDLPKQGRYHNGDTIVTSGYSSVFPEGIIVGVIDDKDIAHAQTSVRVRLKANFAQLSTVRVLNNKMKDEFRSLEEQEAAMTGNDEKKGGKR